MQDDAASGQDTAPVPDPGAASRQEAAPAPNRDTAYGQGELELQPGSAHDGSASAQIGRDPLPRDIGDEDDHQGVEMPREKAPPQERSYPENRQARDKKGLPLVARQRVEGLDVVEPQRAQLDVARCRWMVVPELATTLELEE